MWWRAAGEHPAPANFVAHRIRDERDEHRLARRGIAIPRFGLTSFAAIVSMGYLARWMVYLAIYVAVINTVRASDVEGMWRAMETAILLFAAFGIFQSAFLPGFAQMVYPDSRPYRRFSTPISRVRSSTSA